MTFVKKTIEVEQKKIDRIKIALNVKSEKEALDAVLTHFNTEIHIAEITLKDAGNFDFGKM